MLALYSGAVAAQPQPPSRPFSVLMGEWGDTLEAAEGYFEDGVEQTRKRSADFLRDVRRIRAEASKARSSARRQAELNQRLLEALGPPPGKNDPPELDIVTQRRQGYEADIADYQSRIGLTDLVIKRADGLELAILALNRDERLTRLLQRYPIPLSPQVMGRAVPELLEYFAELARAPMAWFRALTREKRYSALQMLAGMVLLMSLLAWAVRHLLLRRLGRDPGISDPSFSRRLAAAIAEGAGLGILPALLCGVFLYRVQELETLSHGLFGEILWSLLVALLFLVLTIGLTRAALAPALPAWGLFSLAPENARRIYRRIAVVAVIFALAGFLRLSPSVDSYVGSLSDAAIGFSAWVFHTLEALGILWLLPGRLWRVEPDVAEPSDEGQSPDAEPRTMRFWPPFRLIVGILAVASIVAANLGYAVLSDYLTTNILLSGAILGALFILFSLVRELIELMMASALVGRALGIGESARGTAVFWLQAVLTVLTCLIGLFFAASVWGVPLTTLWRWTVEFFGDWQFGSVTLSPADVLLALGVVVLAIVITRLVQRLLLERVLPATRFTPGVQHSIATGTGYIGVTVAVLLGIAALGIDMTNVALLAGALSVGIGFGLRTVANNFISGLVLLFERPVKVGDWVVIGNEEGFVRNINIRSTEIETFEKASVIVPNADMISNALINWTHRDKYGRVDVRVGVAYGEDPQRVREILLECARDHPRVISWYPFEAFVLLQDFGEHRLEFELRCFTADVNQRLGIASDLRFDIRRRLQEAGIQMPLPQQVVHFAPGSPE